MMRRPATALRTDRRGAAAAEFALIVPLWVTLFLALIQLGTLFWASAGLQNALGDGARRASIWPRASTEQIVSAVKASSFGIVAANMPEPTITYGKVNGVDYADINVQYNSKLLIFNVSAITFKGQRRVYLP